MSRTAPASSSVAGRSTSPVSRIEGREHLVDDVEGEPAVSEQRLHFGFPCERLEPAPARELRLERGARGRRLVALSLAEDLVDDDEVHALRAELAPQAERPFGPEASTLVEPVTHEGAVVGVPLLAQALDRRRRLALVVALLQQVATDLEDRPGTRTEEAHRRVVRGTGRGRGAIAATTRPRPRRPRPVPLAHGSPTRSSPRHPRGRAGTASPARGPGRRAPCRR